MDKALVVILTLLFAGAAAAQQYKWVDKDGKVRYGDVPPPGIKATPLRAPPPGSAPAAAAKKPDAAKKGPEDPQKEREKQELAEKQAKVKQENCGHAREGLRTLESGERIARTDAKGERYYLEDAQHAQELAAARKSVQQWCN